MIAVFVVVAVVVVVVICIVALLVLVSLLSLLGSQAAICCLWLPTCFYCQGSANQQ